MEVLNKILLISIWKSPQVTKFSQVVPRVNPNDGVNQVKFHGGLTSGYLARSADLMPKQGDRGPWRRGANYIVQWPHLTFGGLKKDSLEFTTATKKIN